MHLNPLKCIINQTHKIFFPFCLRSVSIIYYSNAQVIVKWNMKCGILETVCETVTGNSNDDEKAKIKATMFFLLVTKIL